MLALPLWESERNCHCWLPQKLMPALVGDLCGRNKGFQKKDEEGEEADQQPLSAKVLHYKESPDFRSQDFLGRQSQ